MPKKSEAAHVPTRRVLLIDDSRNGLAVRKAVLEAEGYAVTACSSARDGLEAFSCGEFHLVVTDYRINGINCADMISALKSQRPEIRVVIVSGLVDVLGLTEHNTGADAVIAKTNTEAANMVRALSRLFRTSRKPVTSTRRRSAVTARRQAG